MGGGGTQEDLKLTQTPAAVVKVLEFELSKERTKFAWLKQEYQRVGAEVSMLTGAKRKLEAKILSRRKYILYTTQYSNLTK